MLNWYCHYTKFKGKTIPVLYPEGYPHITTIYSKTRAIKINE